MTKTYHLRRYLLIVPTILIFALTGCNKSKKDADIDLDPYLPYQNGPGVYMVGWSTSKDSGIVATVWKEGVKSRLPQGFFAYYGAAHQSDLYIAGALRVKDSPYTRAGYWKNGVPVALQVPAESTDSKAIYIYLSGNDIYILGGSQDAQGKFTSLYWKNGVLKSLGSFFFPNSLVVQGIDIYMEGDYQPGINGTTTSNAAFWKNGKITFLDFGYYANGLALLGNDIIIPGVASAVYPSKYSSGVYWRNGTVNYLENFSLGAARAIAIQNNDIYMAGNCSDTTRNAKYYYSVYWKNGLMTKLPAPDGESKNYESRAITVDNNKNIYIAVNTTDDRSQTRSYYYKNGVPFPLSDKVSFVSGIAIVN